MPNPTVSLIIPVHNPTSVFFTLLKTILIQDFSIPFEIIIVDDGSDPEHNAALQREIKKLNLQNLYLWELSQNRGPAHARNFGVKKSAGEVIFFIDSDCIISDRQHLKKMYEAHEKFPDAIIGGALNGMGQSYASFVEHFCRGGNCKADGKQKFLKSGHVVTAHMIVPRSLWKKIGGLNPDLRTGEDVAFCFQALKMKLSVRRHGDLVLLHENSKTMKRFIKRNFDLGRDRGLLRKFVFGFLPIYARGPFIQRCVFIIPVAVALTFRNVFHSLSTSYKVWFAVPGIFLGMLAMAFGVAMSRKEHLRNEAQRLVEA